MKLYHLTDIKNTESISKNGLLTNMPAKVALSDNKFIYVTTNVKKLIDQEDEWKDGNFIIWEIDYKKIIGLTMQVDWELIYIEEEAPFSFYFVDDIPPQAIKMLGYVKDSKIYL